MAVIVCLRRAVELLRLRLRVHGLVAEQLEEAAGHVVRADLGDDVHHAAVAAAVLRLRPRGHEVELLNRLEREELEEAAARVVVGVPSVNLMCKVTAVPSL